MYVSRYFLPTPEEFIKHYEEMEKALEIETNKKVKEATTMIELKDSIYGSIIYPCLIVATRLVIKNRNESECKDMLKELRTIFQKNKFDLDFYLCEGPEFAVYVTIN